MSDLQVVFLSPHSDPEADLGEPDAGGQCVYEHQLAQALVQLPGIQVSTFCRQTGKRPDISRIHPRYSIYRLPAGPEGFIPKEEIDPYLPELVERLQTFLPRHGRTLVHSHYWDGGKTALLLKASTRRKLPFIWTPHSLGVVKRQKFPGLDNEDFYHFIPRIAWESYSGFAARRVIVSSAQEKETMVNFYAVPPEDLEVIPPGVDTTHLQPIDKNVARRQHRLPTAGKMLLCLGRITRSKGYHHAIRALIWLKELYQEEVFLVICGGSSQKKTKEEAKYLRELHQIAIDLHLEENVIFRPAVPHERINEMYSAADVFLMVSESEPFGLTVLEAMTLGVPVVAANQGGPADIIQHNKTGSLVTIYNPRRVAHYVFAFLKDPIFVRHVTDKARQVVDREYSWPTQAKKFLALYHDSLRVNGEESMHAWVRHTPFLRRNLAGT